MGGWGWSNKEQLRAELGAFWERWGPEVGAAPPPGVVGPFIGGFVVRAMCCFGGIESGRFECVMYIYILYNI